MQATGNNEQTKLVISSLILCFAASHEPTKRRDAHRLSQDVQYSQYILPVCLPQQADPDEGNFYEGVKGLVVGWGWIKNRLGMHGVSVDSGP